jgi:excisionase family DNA binding protein
MLDEEIAALLRRPALTVPELAKVLNVSKNSIYEGVKEGRYETIPVGKRSVRIVTAPIRKQLGIAPC